MKVARKGPWPIRLQVVSIVAVVALMSVGCGSSSTGSGGSTSAAPGAATGLSLDQVRLGEDNGDWDAQIQYWTADTMDWPKLGFSKPGKFVFTEDFIAGLIGGSIWVGRGETQTIWGAMGQGSVPLKLVAIYQDGENWVLGSRKPLTNAQLPGLKITGGEPGNRNVTVGRNSLKNMGVNPDSLEWISVPGDPEARLRALIAGQVDVAVLQVDVIPQLKKAGGFVLYNKPQDVPAGGVVVKAETLKNNKDAVCAYVKGETQAAQWLAAGADATTNWDAAVKISEKYGKKVEPFYRDVWSTYARSIFSPDDGSSVKSFQAWNDDMIAQGVVKKGFDWTKNVDFTCLWDAQKALGLELRPNPTEMPK